MIAEQGKLSYHSISPSSTGPLPRRAPAGPSLLRALLTNATCHLASGQSQPWSTIPHRMGVVTKTVLAAAHDNEEIAPASVRAILCGNVECAWENRITT